MRPLLVAVSLAFARLAIAQTAGPDLILTNAKIFTADANAPWAQAIAITGDHISAVGTSDQVKSLAVDSTKQIDAHGAVIIPGLNVAHEDVCMTPAVRLNTEADSSADDIKAAIANLIDESASDVWITGILGNAALSDLTFTTSLLDKASQGRPVVLVSSDGRVVMPNSAAMSALHISDAKDPVGGSWQRDASGHSTGKALDYAARNILRRWSEETSEEDATTMLQAWADYASRHGVTTAQVVPCTPYARFEKLVRHASLPIRVRIINAPGTNSGGRNIDELREMPPPAGARAMLSVSGIEWASTLPKSELTSILKEGTDANQQILFDVNDKDTALLDVLKSADTKSRRVRLERAAASPELHDLGVVVVDSPTPKSLLKSGVPIALGPDPWNTMRRLLADSKEGLTRTQIIDAYTRGGAVAEGTEGEKGVLAPGKVADLVVLSQDIFEVPVSRITDTASVFTIIGGRVAYDAQVLIPPKASEKK